MPRKCRAVRPIRYYARVNIGCSRYVMLLLRSCGPSTKSIRFPKRKIYEYTAVSCASVYNILHRYLIMKRMCSTDEIGIRFPAIMST